MSDLSISSAQKGKQPKAIINNQSKFADLKSEYELRCKKLKRSDLANSPVLLEQELTLLSKMKEAAKEEKLDAELAKINEREQAIYTKLSNRQATANISNSYYVPVSFSGINSASGFIGEESSVKISYDTYLEKLSSKFGKDALDENAKEIVKILADNGFDITKTSYILKNCLQEDAQTPDDKVDAVRMLVEAGLSSSVIPQIIEELVVADSDKMDLASCRSACSFKTGGFDDSSCLKLAKFLRNGFEDEEKVQAHLQKLFNNGISADAAMKLADILKTESSETGLHKLNDASMQSIIRCKKTLNLTRDNEKKERNNPINQLGVQVFTIDKDVIIFKDGKVIHSTPVEGESVYDIQQEYDELISKLEDNLLCDFASKYKNADGTIDSKYVRTFIALRRMGITYGQMLNVLEKCFMSDGSIDKDNLNNIDVLKKAGALSDDIPVILDACQTDASGKYTQEDINNAKILTESVIGGNEIVQLLPSVRNNEDIRDFVVDFSPLFEDKKFLIELVDLIKDEDGAFDENAMNVIYHLAENLFNSDSKINESDFMSYASRIIDETKNPKEKFVSDEGAGIVAVMNEKGFSVEDIISALTSSRNEKGVIDEKLSDIVWTMSFKNADIGQISEVLKICKENGGINYNIADMVLSLLENNTPIDKIIETVIK